MKTLSMLLKENNINVEGQDENLELIDNVIKNPNIIEHRNTIAARVYRSSYNRLAMLFFELNIDDNSKLILEAGLIALNALKSIEEIQ